MTMPSTATPHETTPVTTTESPGPSVSDAKAPNSFIDDDDVGSDGKNRPNVQSPSCHVGENLNPERRKNPMEIEFNFTKYEVELIFL